MSSEVGGPDLGGPYGKGPQASKGPTKCMQKRKLPKKQHNVSQKGPFLEVSDPPRSLQDMKFLEGPEISGNLWGPGGPVPPVPPASPALYVPRTRWAERHNGIPCQRSGPSDLPRAPRQTEGKGHRFVSHFTCGMSYHMSYWVTGQMLKLSNLNTKGMFPNKFCFRNPKVSVFLNYV